jgi:hypothetical protein
MSAFYQDACPGISLRFSGVDCPFAVSDTGLVAYGDCNMRGFAFLILEK